MKVWKILIILILSPSIFANEPFISREAFHSMTPPDRAEVYNHYQENVKSCTKTHGDDATCGRVRGISKGDKNFNDPFYAHIPRGTEVQVYTDCDENEGKFYTRVYYRDSKGNWKNFRNPLTEPTNSTKMNGKAGMSERWLTSPGIYNYHPENYPTSEAKRSTEATPHYRWRTPLSTEGAIPGNSNTMIMNEWHVVSQAKDWSGDIMPWAVQVEGDIFYHASHDVTGHPESHGCMRLKSTNAMALFNLIRRAGTGNVAFNWGGYGRTNPATDEPFCAGKYDKNGKLLNDNQRVYAKEGTQDRIRQKSSNASRRTRQTIGDWFRKHFGTKPRQNQNDGYVPPESVR